jgi:hypothetical protein
MTSLRMLGQKPLVALMQKERGHEALVDLSFLLFGGDQLTSGTASDLLRQQDDPLRRTPCE